MCHVSSCHQLHCHLIPPAACWIGFRVCPCVASHSLPGLPSLPHPSCLPCTLHSGLRSRYVDTFNPGGGATATPPSSSPPASTGGQQPLLPPGSIGGCSTPAKLPPQGFFVPSAPAYSTAMQPDGAASDGTGRWGVCEGVIPYRCMRADCSIDSAVMVVCMSIHTQPSWHRIQKVVAFSRLSPAAHLGMGNRTGTQ